MAEANQPTVSDRVTKALEGVNLTQYEISLYLTLIKHGALNARELSEKSSVPYSRIYNILSMLLDKGYITRDDNERPSTYKANPPDEALMHARKKLVDDFNAHSKIIVEELNDIYLKNSNAPFQVSLLIYRGKEAVFTKSVALLNAATQSIMIAANNLEDLKENGIIDALTEKRLKGIVDIKILIEQDDEHKEIVEELTKIGQVRVRDQLFGTGIAVDSVDAIILLKAQLFSITSYFGMKSDFKGFGSIAAEYFSYLYNTATEYTIE
ncbi:MAG TPA: helix-turn-helix domain-containing protein [Candidatus Lokiarchaeia archaeon]|nr:helix-turn-helix domain-containing protein [Candidatus Lokiarchaeia archaeon]